MAGIIKQIDQSLDISFDAGKRYAGNTLKYLMIFALIAAVTSIGIMINLALYVSIGSALLINAGWAVMGVNQAALASVVGSIVTFGALAGFLGLYQIYKEPDSEHSSKNVINTILFAGMAGVLLGPLVTLAGMAVLGMGGAQTMSFLASSVFIGGGFIIVVPLVLALIVGLAINAKLKGNQPFNLDDDGSEPSPQPQQKPSVSNNGSAQDENDKNGPVLHAYKNQKQSDKLDGKKDGHLSNPIHAVKLKLN